MKSADDYTTTTTRRSMKSSYADEFKGFPGMTEEEQNQFAIKSPKLYALTGTVWSLAVDTIPHLKYTIPKEREKFLKLDKNGQHMALLKDAFGTALGVGLAAYGRAPVFKAGGSKGIISAGRGLLAARKAKKFAIEDTLSFINKNTRQVKVKPFSFDHQAGKSLRALGFNNDEIEALKVTLKSGDRGALKQTFVTRAFANKKPSKAWNKYIQKTGEPYGGFKPNDELLRQVNERKLHAAHWKRQYNKVLSREILGKDFPTAKFPRFVYEKRAKKLIDQQRKAMKEGADVSGLTFDYDEMTADATQRVIRDMLRHKGAVSSMAKPGAGRFMPLGTIPARTVFGTGEELYGTMSNIYKPIKGATEETKDYVFHKTFTWQQMLKQRGLGELKFNKFGEYKFIPAKEFTAKAADDAYQILRGRDDLYEAFRKGSISEKELKTEVRKLFDGVDNQSVVGQTIHAWDDFADTLYGEYAVDRIEKILRKSDLTDIGSDGIDLLMVKVRQQLTQTFSTTNSLSYVDKRNTMKQVLEDVKKLLIPKEGKHAWFKQEGKALEAQLQDLHKEFTLGKEGRWIGYLENYTARISHRNSQLGDQWSNSLLRKAGFFTKRRTAERLVGEPVDFTTMIEGRISSQARDMFLNETIEDVVKFSGNLPSQWAKHTEHYISRLMGRPSGADEAMANMLNRFGSRMGWDGRRVMRAAQTLNDLTYLGALGFKPFSAARNLFQPLITLPADLGGVKDYRHLAKGMVRGFSPKTKRYIREIGAIAEYAPEITQRQAALPFGRLRQIGGRQVELPRLQKMRDVGMWMFRGSDRFNRYVSGGAALNKWEAAQKAIPVINKSTVNSFMKKSGASLRNPWMRNEIKDLLMRGQFDEAKAAFVKDVIADTQFLYGAVDSPMFMSRGGVGSTITLFQSWWMNYASLLDKFVHTGSAPAKAQRMFTWMISSSIAYNVMESLWGEQMAKKSTRFGPMPTEINEFMIPPAWTPVYRALRTGVSALELNPDATSKEVKKFFSSLAIFFPAGLQIKKTARAVREEGFEGFAPSILGLKREQNK